MPNSEPLNESDRRLLRDVEEHGWHAVLIDDDEPSPYVFSVGLMHTLRHPELALFGLDSAVTHRLMWDIYRSIATGRRFDEEVLYDGVVEGYAIAVRRVHPSWHARYLGYAQWHRRYLLSPGTLEAVQIVWPDRAGLFPWEDGCEPAIAALQPRLDQPVPEEAADE